MAYDPQTPTPQQAADEKKPLSVEPLAVPKRHVEDLSRKVSHDHMSTAPKDVTKAPPLAAPDTKIEPAKKDPAPVPAATAPAVKAVDAKKPAESAPAAAVPPTEASVFKRTAGPVAVQEAVPMVGHKTVATSNPMPGAVPVTTERKASLYASASKDGPTYHAQQRVTHLDAKVTAENAKFPGRDAATELTGLGSRQIPKQRQLPNVVAEVAPVTGRRDPAPAQLAIDVTPMVGSRALATPATPGIN
jgi:hypothetical protein